MPACKCFYSFSRLSSYLLPPSIPLCSALPNISHSCNVLGICEVCLDTALIWILTQRPGKCRICSLFASCSRQTFNPTSSVSERRRRYTWQAVFCTPPRPFPLCVCRPSFPRKEHRIYECMPRATSPEKECFLRTVGRRGRHCCVCMGEQLHRNTIQQH